MTEKRRVRHGNFNELAAKTSATNPDWDELLDAARRDVVEEHLAYGLAELRSLAGVTQVELANLLGVSQPAVSKLERAGDLKISSIAQLLEALGAEMRIVAVFRRDDGTEVDIPINVPAADSAA